MTWNTRRFCIALHCRSLSGIIPFLLMYSGEYTSFTSKEANSAAQSRYSELFWPPTRIIFESEETWKYYSSWAVDCDTYECFCRLQSNVFDAASLFQTNHVVHWNVPREDIFFCVASWLFRIACVHLQRVYLQEESLPPFLSCRMHLKNRSEFVLIIFYLQLINSGHADSSMADKKHGKLSSWR